jgi:hypothetical protein
MASATSAANLVEKALTEFTNNPGEVTIPYG